MHTAVKGTGREYSVLLKLPPRTRSLVPGVIYYLPYLVLELVPADGFHVKRLERLNFVVFPNSRTTLMLPIPRSISAMPSDPSDSVARSDTSYKEGNERDHEKELAASTSGALAEVDDNADADEVEYPTGPRFWAVMVALVLSMLLVQLSIVYPVPWW